MQNSIPNSREKGGLTTQILPKHKRFNKNMINPLPIPSPLNGNSRPSKSIIDIDSIDEDRGALSKDTVLVLEDNGEGLVVG